MIKSLVSVLIPSYNAEETIERCLDSVAQQDYSYIELIIADNNSQDMTPSLINKYLPRFAFSSLFIHRKINIGAFLNFKNLLNEASGEYAIFLPSDDYWIDSTLISSLVRALRNNPSAVSATPQVYFEVVNNKRHKSDACDSLIGNKNYRLLKLISSFPNDNSRFYSLFKLKDLKYAFNSSSYCHAFDWLLICKLALAGDFIECASAKLIRATSSKSSYLRALGIDNAKWFSFGRPLLPLIYQLVCTQYWYLIVPKLPLLIRADRKLHKKYLALH
jgi:glycosyltransferase involved in cell wall biosynthesis